VDSEMETSGDWKTRLKFNRNPMGKLPIPSSKGRLEEYVSIFGRFVRNARWVLSGAHAFAQSNLTPSQIFLIGF